MKFTSIPANWSCVAQPLVYDISLGQLQPVTNLSVVDADSRDILATLRFVNAAFLSVDIAPYVRRHLDARPLGLKTSLQTAEERLMNVVVEVDGTQSEVRTFTLHTLDGLPRIISARPFERNIAAGEYDELPLYAPKGGRLTITGHKGGTRSITLPPADYIFYHTFSPDTSPSSDAWRVLFSSDGREDEIIYTLVRRSGRSVRIGWLSSTGTIEQYTFPTIRRHARTAEKSRFYAADGWTLTDIADEETLLLESDHEPRATIESLGEILTARRVWLMDGPQVRELDVISAETRHGADNGAPCTFAVEVRTRKREEALQC